MEYAYLYHIHFAPLAFSEPGCGAYARECMVFRVVLGRTCNENAVVSRVLLLAMAPFSIREKLSATHAAQTFPGRVVYR